MALTFYAASGSPYVWRVWLALEHKKVPYTIEMLSFDADDTRKPAYLALNPRGKVPAIVDDGLALYESAAIVDYLEERYPTPRVFPADLRERAIARRIIREVDEYVAHPLERVVTQVLFTKEAERDADELEAARAALVDEVGRWESLLAGDWLVGASPSAADHALYPLLALLRRIEARFGVRLIASHLGPKLSAWMARVEALPYFDATYPPHWRR